MLKSTYFVMALLVCILPPKGWAVSNAVVGTCRKGTPYTTVQAAIDAADAGSTVQVCPGVYPEVLSIQKNLNLKGVASAGSDTVRITIPPTGVPANAASGNWSPLYAQVLVQQGTVNLSNLVIDGSGSACGGGWQVGVLFQDASGSLTNSSFTKTTQCYYSISALLDTTTNFSFSNNYLGECVGACLQINNAANTTVKGNQFQSTVQTSYAVFGNSLAGPATFSGNTIGGNVLNGILLSNSPSVTITGNTIAVAPTGTGIFLEGSTQNVVQSNRVSGDNGIVVFDDRMGTGGNIITKNTLRMGSCGLGIYPINVGDTTAPNTYFNDQTTICTLVP